MRWSGNPFGQLNETMRIAVQHIAGLTYDEQTRRCVLCC